MVNRFHTIGDSHSCAGWPGYVIKHHVGAKLCYSFGRDRKQLVDISRMNIEDGDTVIFCFGEIDCRGHVYKYITSTNTYEMVLDSLVKSYFEAIKESVGTVCLKKVCVYNVVPTVQTFDKGGGHPDFPWLGTDEERKKYVRYFNEQIKFRCEENGYLFFDIFDKYVDSDGFLNKSLSDGCVHIRDSTFIEQFIKENL